jgi:hypothetical protein
MRLRRTIAPLLALTLALSVLSGTASAAPTPLTLTVSPAANAARITGDEQGFSVETADFAHGFLTRARMAEWFKTLGKHGVLRLGGYSMDLVWPAFGPAAGTPAPDWAIGGTVDQSDFDQLRVLLDETGWRVTLGAPLASVLNGQVSMEQMVAEVRAANATLGRHLLAVEVGNEFDHVTSLTSAQYYAELKQYHDAIAAALPGTDIRMTGPSANTSTSNARLDDFISAALGDTSTTPPAVLSELSSHWYPTSHCGSSTTTIGTLLSGATYIKTRTKLQGVVAEGDRLGGAVPSVINESNSSSCSGMPGVSNAYATALWSLDYLMQAAQNGIARLQFHTNTAALCGDLKPRDSDDYPISYRYYGAFCAADQATLDGNRLSAAPEYYGMWAFRQVPQGQFVDLGLPDSALDGVRAYGVESRHDELTVVLINPQDPATGSGDAVTLNLPAAYGRASAITLRSSAPDGLASTDASAITLAGRSITSTGRPTGPLLGTGVAVHGSTATVTVAAGTAQLVTFSGPQR